MCMCVYIYIYIYVSIYLSISLSLYIYIYIHIYIYILQICILYKHIHVYTYISIYIYMYMFIIICERPRLLRLSSYHVIAQGPSARREAEQVYEYIRTRPNTVHCRETTHTKKYTNPRGNNGLMQHVERRCGHSRCRSPGRSHPEVQRGGKPWLGTAYSLLDIAT